MAMFDVPLAIAFGVALGVFAGLCPGMHPNTLFFVSLSLLSSLGFSPLAAIAFVLSLAVTDIFVNFVPNIFLSVPDTSLVLNVLPGHKLVLEGKGYDALFISIFGAFSCLILSVALMPLLIHILPILHAFIYPYIHILLILTIVWMVAIEEGFKAKLCCLLIYLLSGLWGLITLNSPLIKSEVVIFPALTGLFGLSNLLVSAGRAPRIPEQKPSKDVDLGKAWKFLAIGFVAGLLSGVLPGVGQAQTGVMASTLLGATSKEFLGSLSGIAMSNFIFSIVSLYSIGKVRSGAAAAIERATEFELRELALSAAVLLASGSIAALLTWNIGKRFLRHLQKVNYGGLTKAVAALIILLVLAFAGPVGLFVLVISTAIGLLPILLRTKRTAGMGYLMIPTILFFSGVNPAYFFPF